MLDGRNNTFFSPWEQMFFLMQIILIVLPFSNYCHLQFVRFESNMAAVQNLYCSVHQSGWRDITWKPRIRKRDGTNQIMGKVEIIALDINFVWSIKNSVVCNLHRC